MNTVPPPCAPGAKIPEGLKMSKCTEPEGFDPEDMDLAAVCAGKKVIMLGLPGAFTPCWSGKTIPGYLAALDALKEKGVGLVMCFAVNDAAVMRSWSTDQKCDGTIIEFYGDPSCAVTKALGLEMEERPDKFGTPRCKRFAMVIEDGVVKMCNICAASGDPAGDDAPEMSFVDEIMKSL